MIEAARQAWVVFCPQQRMDAMHAALFTKPNVQMLRINGMNGRLDTMFDALGGLDQLIQAAMAGTLSPQVFIKALAARKTFAPYLKNLVRRARDKGHEPLAVHLCRQVLKGGPDPYYIKQLQDMGEPVPTFTSKDAATG